MAVPENTSQGVTSERARAFHAALTKACIPRIDRATVPIIGVQNDRIVHDRSGVLYRIGDKHFVLTAAHYLRSIVEHNIGLLISVNRADVAPLPLAEARFLSTEYPDGDVTSICRDIAAIYIPDDVAMEVAKYKDFLYHNQINLAPDPHGLYLFYGYPEQWAGHLITETGIVSKALAFSTFEDCLDPGSVQNYDAEVHMVLNFSQSAVQAMTGTVEQLPRLPGISGCGIWRVGERQGRRAMPKTDETLTLVAIEHGVFNGLGRVKATRIRYALDLIATEYPDTRHAMSLIYPRT
jgi:hypothetical protein